MRPTNTITPPAADAPKQLVRFLSWHNGYRGGEVAGFSAEDAARLCDVEKVAVRHRTEEERGKAEAAALKAQAAAEKEAKEAEAKAKAEADEKAKKETDDSKKGRG